MREEDIIREKDKKLADYAMACDLVSHITSSASEASAIESLMDLLRTLCAPSRIIYISIVEGQPSEVITFPEKISAKLISDLIHNFKDDYEWTTSGEGFRVRIKCRADVIGLIDIDGLLFPQHKGHYLNLLLTVASAIGLSIFNSRIYQSLIKTNKQLEKEIEKRKIAANALKERENMLVMAAKKWEDTFNAIPDLLMLLDDDHKILKINKSMAEVLGITPEGVAGKKCYELVHKTDTPLDVCPHTQLLQDGMEHKVEVHDKNMGRHFLLSTSPLRNPEGKLIGSIHISRDITEIKERDIKLRQEYEKIQSILAAIGDGITIQDREFKIIFQNQALKNIFGEHIGEHCYRVYENNDCICDGCPVLPSFTDGNVHKSTRRLVTINKMFENTASPIKDSNGDIIACIEIVRDITDSKIMEDEIQRRKIFLQKILDNTTNAIYSIDLNGNFLLINNKTSHITGYSAAELTGRSFSILFDNGTLPQVNEQFIKVSVHGQTIINYETGLIQKNGVRRLISFSIAPIYDDEKIVMVVGTAEDITERKLMEAKLKEISAQLQAVIDSSPTVIFIRDIKGRYLLVNNQYEKLFHVTKEAIAGKTVYELFPKEFADKLRANDAEVKEKNLPISFEEILPLDDGVHTFIAVKFPLSDIKGQVYGICGIATDITERKRMEEDLINSEARFKKLFRMNAFPLCYVNSDGVIIDYSDRFIATFGYTRKDIPTLRQWWQLAYPDPDYRRWVMSTWGAALQRAVDNNTEVQPIEYNVTCKNGEVRTVVISGVTFDNNFLATFFDVTQRKQMEKELKQLNTNLELMVAAETQKRMQQEQLLIQQSKMASMGEMISMISHQWRQPLNAIALTVQDMEETYAYNEFNGEYFKRTVNITMDQVTFMSKTIDDFRNFFKPSKDKVQFDVKSAIEDILAMFAQMFKKSDVDISISTEPDTMLIAQGYPNEFKQVILNIINNSKDAITSRREADYRIDGLIEINIGNSEEKDKVIVSIKDNGGGIPAHVLDKIFDSYYSTKGEKGTGIGLYMSKTIIETNMGGSLTARNVDGGAAFTISLDIIK